MKLTGKVATIIFKNEVNSWTVLLLKTDTGGYLTAVGETTDIEVGDDIELEGELGEHKVYGKQFKFETYVKTLPKTASALIAYIADNVKGVGKKTAKAIVNEFGDETTNIIKNKPDKLRNIKGLNEEKIDNLNIFFNEEWEKWNVVSYLSNFNISVIIANKIFKTLGQDTITIIKENPYSLIKFVKRLDFKIVDNIGRAQGISLENEDRIDTGIIFSINDITEFGHTCIEYGALVKYAAKVLEVSEECIKNSITRLVLNDKLFIQEIGEENYIFRSSYYLAEQNIASGIIRHTKEEIIQKDYTKNIKKVSKKNDIELSEDQKNAIQTCLNHGISVITGGPGTGKTTIVKCLIDILESMDKEYVLCAPTGRAAKRLSQTTGKQAKTLHRLLEITKVDDNDVDAFYEMPVSNIETDMIIIDESSMIDTLMMNNLFKAINIKTQIVMVGDVNQLPSVGPGSVLKDIILSNTVPVIYLNQIYRQSAESDIIVNAHKVNNGEYPEFKTKDTDLFFIKSDSVEKTVSQLSSLISYRLKNFANLDTLKDLQILTPMKKTGLGVIELNATVQAILNPKEPHKNEREYGGKIFREGDKVMQIVNNYDKKFAINGEFFDGVFNGDIGFIKKIDNINQKMIVIYDDEKEVVYEFDELEQLEHAYAVTIHKSQGSEFDYVILPLYVSYPKLFTRNLLYTAMTRAKKMLIIVGSQKVINYMVDNVDSKNRKTGLKEKLVQSLNKS